MAIFNNPFSNSKPTKPNLGQPPPSINNPQSNPPQPDFKQPAAEKPIERKPQRIDLSHGKAFQLEEGQTKHDLYQLLTGIVKDPGVRGELASTMWYSRGRGGVKAYELTKKLDELRDNGRISNWQHKQYKKDFRIYH